jgi:hypothetical protein
MGSVACLQTIAQRCGSAALHVPRASDDTLPLHLAVAENRVRKGGRG